MPRINAAEGISTLRLMRALQISRGNGIADLRRLRGRHTVVVAISLISAHLLQRPSPCSITPKSLRTKIARSSGPSGSAAPAEPARFLFFSSRTSLSPSPLEFDCPHVTPADSPQVKGFSPFWREQSPRCFMTQPGPNGVHAHLRGCACWPNVIDLSAEGGAAWQVASLSSLTLWRRVVRSWRQQPWMWQSRSLS